MMSQHQIMLINKIMLIIIIYLILGDARQTNNNYTINQNKFQNTNNAFQGFDFGVSSNTNKNMNNQTSYNNM